MPFHMHPSCVLLESTATATFEVLAFICCLNQNAKDEGSAVMQQLHGAESEVNALRSMTQRMILTQKEMVCHCIVGRSLL